MVTMSQSEIDVAIQRQREATIRILDVHKYYDLGETRVHALRAGSPWTSSVVSLWPSWEQVEVANLPS